MCPITGSTAARRDPHLELVRVVVPAVAFVDVDVLRLHAGEAFPVGDHGAERVAAERVAVQRLRVQHELDALGLRHGRCDRTLQPNS